MTITKQLTASKNTVARYLAVAPYLFWLLLLITTILLLIELSPSHNGWPYWDKVEHIAIFAALGCLGCLSYASKLYWLAIGLISYGFLTEWLQGILTMTRVPSFYDWLADCIGILLGILFAYFVRKFTLAKG